MDTILLRYLGRGELEFLKANPRFQVDLDRADVAWIRGYCHLLMGMLDTMLAFDSRQLWDGFCEVLIAKPIKDKPSRDPLQGVDIHQPSRLTRAHGHFLKMCERSRETCRYALAEIDHENEWLPNSKQTSAFGLKVDQAMIDSWHELLTEADTTLTGNKLLIWDRPKQQGFDLHAWG